VPYPPPAAVPEVAPPRPSKQGAAWLDGSWQWTGDTYVWLRGGWVVPPRGARIVPWTLRYEDDGSLWFSPTDWVDEQGRPIRHPEILEPASFPRTEQSAAQHID
jgi:hypothetical protein